MARIFSTTNILLSLIVRGGIFLFPDGDIACSHDKMAFQFCRHDDKFIVEYIRNLGQSLSVALPDSVDSCVILIIDRSNLSRLKC